MKTKMVCLLLVISILVVLSGCDVIENFVAGSTLIFSALTENDKADKSDIFEFVHNNEKELLLAVDNNDFSGFTDDEIIKEIKASETVVDFYCGGSGFGSATSYTGFYYTPDNDMSSLWCAPSEDLLTVSGNGYEYTSGDDRYYTEKICECFYYYEASF